jgi:hypothetical protein
MSLTARLRLLRELAPAWLAALWWGSLTTIGFLVVPQLFLYLPTPAMAGSMAAKLFTAQTWVSLNCGLLLLLFLRPDQASSLSSRARTAMIFIVAGMLLALLSEFAVAPRIVARENLALWHRVGSGLYLLQWLCAGAAFWRLAASGHRSQV